MFDNLKSLHRAADHAKAKAVEALAEVEATVRHIEALVPALTAEEKELYDAFLKEREKIKAKL